MTRTDLIGFDPETETVEELGPFLFMQEKRGQRLTGDPVMLVDFVLPLREGDRVIDLGTGTGAIPLLLSWKAPGARVTGVEVMAGPAAVASRNVEANGLARSVEIVRADFRELEYPAGSFDLVVSNPPYVKAGSGRTGPDPVRTAARSEVHGGLRDLVRVSAHLAGGTGSVCCVYPVKRLDEMLCEFSSAGLRPVRLRFVHPGPGRAAELFLVEAARAGELTVEPPLFIGRPGNGGMQEDEAGSARGEAGRERK